MNRLLPTLSGAGLGLRRPLMGALAEHSAGRPDFLEVAPENWIDVGGNVNKAFQSLVEDYPLVCHGLSLSLGGPMPLDEDFVYKIKQFLNRHQVRCYSEHLSYCGDDGHLYDLLPIPFTEEAVHYVASRIRRVQDILERRIAVENISYYAKPGQQLSEIDFINAVLDEADCELLLDVNNVYVNSINHQYDASTFLRQIPVERIAYIHMAGHFVEDVDLLIDTHGADVNDAVWELLAYSYELFGSIPTLLERDFNIPPLNELLKELRMIRRLQYRNVNYVRDIA